MERLSDQRGLVYGGGMFIPDSFLIAALVVLVFVILAGGIEELLEERRWLKRHKERASEPRDD